MRIILVTSGLSAVGQGGGISSYVHDLACNFSLHQHEVYVFLVAQHSLIHLKVAAPYKLQFFALPNDRALELPVAEKIYNAIEDLSPDAVINNDVACLAGLWPILGRSITRISVMHGFSDRSVWNNFGIQGKMACLHIDDIDYVVCQNQDMLKAAAYKYGLPLKKLYCIHQTVKIPDNQVYLSSRGITNAPFRIVFAGGDSERKGAGIMCQIAQRLSRTDKAFEVHWCLPASRYAKLFSSDSRFIFHGRISREDFLSILGYSDCIIIPSKLDTGPLLLVEAMAYGLTPICNDLRLSSIPDIIENGVNGFRIKDNNPDLYWEVLTNMMQSQELCASIGKSAKKYFMRELSTERQYEEFVNLIQEAKQSSNIEKRVGDGFTTDYMIYNHNHSTVLYPKYSLKRIIPKLLTYWEVPLTYKLYNQLKWLGL